MKVTVCQLRSDPAGLTTDWQNLVEHVQEQQSELVVLPEMCFHPWLANQPHYDERQWQSAITAHDDWIPRLAELYPAIVVSSRPVTTPTQRLNEGFIWQKGQYRACHQKYYLPDEPSFWEAKWYQRGDGNFAPAKLDDLSLGFLICTEMWFMQHARAYGQDGVHILVTPRATERVTVDKWLAGGRTAAVIAGAYSLSSNHVNDVATDNTAQTSLGGQGWIIGPNGEVLEMTSRQTPFVTHEIALALAEQAKQTYPRYVEG